MVNKRKPAEPSTHGKTTVVDLALGMRAMEKTPATRNDDEQCSEMLGRTLATPVAATDAVSDF